MHGKIDTRIGRAFAPITEVDDEQMIKYKSDDGESIEMKASSAKTMPKDHPAKVEYDKLSCGDDDAAKKDVNIFDEPDGPDDGGEGSDDDWEDDDWDDGGEGSDDDWDRDPDLDPGDDGGDYAKPGDDDWEDEDEDEPTGEIDFDDDDKVEKTVDDMVAKAATEHDFNSAAAKQLEGEIMGPWDFKTWEDYGEHVAKKAAELAAHRDRGSTKRESIAAKGSFRKVKEQWLNSIL